MSKSVIIGATTILLMFFTCICCLVIWFVYNESVKSNRADLLTSCLTVSEESYKKDWERYCKNFSLGEDKGNPGSCLLPQAYADEVEKTYEQQKQECLNLYK